MSTSLAPMKTEIARFCQDYTRTLDPLNETLRKRIELIRGQPDMDELKSQLSGLSDVHHRLKTLADKVAAQQAYVIIFGPLKSGKSTLMNAFSGAYVSEVTALPAYPCLVHVRHGEKEHIVATRFNGQTEIFSDYRQMQEAICGYHKELAERIRLTEALGETFDPGIHYPDAIRRLDISLPAEPLKESYTVLVDTPGLYSRMKFGYDLMSREFRDSAACAVFVVKTDNLFLEQVFNEFNELLGLFSRIFLVVNIDAGKRDLGPTGALVPSLESSDPQRIVEAFRDLSMSAPLRKAYEDGRLQIHPIDLLHAAKERLSRDEIPLDAESNDVPIEDPDPEDVVAESGPGEPLPETAPDDSLAPAGAPEEQSDPAVAPFEGFMSELTNYLNSNDYLIHFLRDSLRQGRNLAGEIQGHCAEENLKAFLLSQTSLELSLEREKERRAALGQLKELDWDGSFTDLREQITRAAEGFKDTERERVTGQLLQELDRWFEDEESLSILLKDGIGPAQNVIPQMARDHVMEEIKKAANTPYGGATLPSAGGQALSKAGVSLLSMRQRALTAAQRVGEATSLPGDGLSSKSMPVRRTFWDWILFRSMTRVRESIFGPDTDPSRAIPLKVKRTRLGDASKKAFRDALEASLARTFDALPKVLAPGMIDAYIRCATASVREVLAKACDDLDREIPGVERRIEAKASIRKAMGELLHDAEQYDHEMEALESAFAHLHPSQDPNAESPDASPDDEPTREGSEDRLDDEEDAEDAEDIEDAEDAEDELLR